MTISVMTFNAWSDHPRHTSWESRREACAAVFRDAKADVVAGQEFTLGMLRDLETMLPEYRWIGAGRDDGKEAGEFTPVFYRPDRMNLLESGTFWLAPDGTCNALGWDACCRRTATWARLAAREDGRRFCVFSTHFDHFGRAARRESAAMLVRRGREIAGDEPLIVAGDFNCREGSAPYRVIAASLRDARSVTRKPPEGPARTWRGWSRFGLGARRIDFIFCSDGVEVERCATLDGAAAGIASDHRPVWAELLM